MKNNKTILAILIILLTTATMANASVWQQYTQTNPTSGSITTIKTYSTYAMALTNARDIILFNGTRWNQISPPNTLGGIFTSMSSILEKATPANGKFYVAMYNTTTLGYASFNPETMTWTNLGTDPATSGLYGFACIHKGVGYTGSSDLSAECYIQLLNYSIFSPSSIGGGGVAVPSQSSGIIIAGESLFAGNYQFNGFSWVNLGGFVASLAEPQSYDDSNIIILNRKNQPSQSAIYVYNATLGAMQGLTGVSSGNYWSQIAYAPDSSKIHRVGSDGIYISQSFFNSTFTFDTNTTGGTPQTINFDDDNENGWVGTSNGKFYYYGVAVPPNPPSSQGTGFQLTDITINPNPTIYGTSMDVSVKPISDYGNFNTINVGIYENASNPNTWVYGWQWINAPNGTTQTKNIGGIEWANFETNRTYTIVMNMTNLGGNKTSNYLTNWTITSGGSTNQTGYNQTEYNSTNNQITSILAIDKLGANRVFATAKNNNELAIISYDITNPTNINTKIQNLNATSGASQPTSLSITNNYAYYGTDNELFVFNNTAYGDATRLNKIGSYGYGLLSADYVYDTTSINDENAWTCRQGTIYDDAQKFNTTSQTFTDTINQDPCLGILYNEDLLYIHKGTSGIKIYNETTQTLLATITGIVSQPSATSHDRLSTYNNFLFAITQGNEITKYNVTNASNPIKGAVCYANYEILSIEAISENEIIVGTTNGLRVCDFTNTNNYNALTGKYLSNNLKTYTTGEIPHEIIAMNDEGKYAVAEDNKIGIYYYAKTNITNPINEPPTITSISTATTNICVNQTFTVTINAIDPNDDEITYDLDCIATNIQQQNNYISNRFSCQYSTTGTKIIKAFATDGTSGTVTSTKTVYSVDCETNNFLNFEIRDYDTPSTLLNDVLTNVIGYTSSTTNEAGQVTFTLENAGRYNVSFSKTGYITTTYEFTTTNSNYIIYLQSLTPTNTNASRNVLFINIKDENNNIITTATTSITDPTTGISATKYSDVTGTATYTDLPSNINLRISVGKTGYTTTYQEVYMQNAETKTITITMPTVRSAQFQGSGRGCKDYVNGVFLCSPLNISGTGDNCQIDSDCITDRCMATTSGLNKKCSNFNYTYCDELGLDRGNTCLVKANAMRGGTNLSGFILDNFLIVLAIVAVSIFAMMWIRSFKRN